MSSTDTDRTVDEQKAEAAEKEAQPIVFEFGGKRYEIESDAANDLELYEAMEDDKYLTAIRGFLGREQWDEFKDAHRNEKGRVPMEPVEEFLNTLMEAVGEGN